MSRSRSGAQPGPAPGAPKARLDRYRAKRNFAVTPEPEDGSTRRAHTLSFVIQKHQASHLHYDFRLELDAVLLSWAVPKGPSLDPAQKRLAVQVEDHPLAYGSFEGTIPPKQYGAGTVIVWDRGTWEPVGDANDGLARGKLEFRLHGEKLAGRWELIRTGGGRQPNWLLFKKRDEWARPAADYDVVMALPDSVVLHPLGLLDARRPAIAVAASGSALADDPIELLRGVKKTRLPATLKPQLATLVKSMPGGDDWVHEIKWDGYRILARISDGRAQLFTRGGHDWSAKMPSLVHDVAALGVADSWLDGEVVVLDDRGVPDFNALQNAFDAEHTDDLRYFIFDAPFLEGRDLRVSPLQMRRALVQRLIAARGSGRVRFSEAFEAPASSLLAAACSMHLEGIVAKRRDSRYVSARADSWLKVKCSRRQEFVIAGFTDRGDDARSVGSLVLAYHRGGTLRAAGSVGTGWSSEEGVALRERLAPLEVPEPKLAPVSGQRRWPNRRSAAMHWVQPRLVGEVEFASWTPDGLVRHASFKGLRMDKTARDVTRETDSDVKPVARVASRAPARVGSVKVSHGERVIDASTGMRKIDLVRYYESIAPRLLPHLQGRPVSLVRGPDGVDGELFFQKHDNRGSIPGVRELDPGLWPGHAGLLAIPNADGIVSAAQMNVLEFHTWNVTTRSIGKPDRIVFDIDPGEGIEWNAVGEAATLLRTLLAELKLQSWLKTSGGKGLHVVVPLAARTDSATVKHFSQAVVAHLARTFPTRFAVKSGASNRVGRIFIDYLRNGAGQTTAAAFSARARPGLGVSMPLAWDELPSVRSGAQWTITTAREHLSFEKQDPWAGYWRERQTLTAAIRAQIE